MMSRTIVVPEDLEAFPPEVRSLVGGLQQRLAAAQQDGDLLRARGIRLSLEIQAIFWLTPDVSGAST